MVRAIYSTSEMPSTTYGTSALPFAIHSISETTDAIRSIPNGQRNQKHLRAISAIYCTCRGQSLSIALARHPSAIYSNSKQPAAAASTNSQSHQKHLRRGLRCLQHFRDAVRYL